jgi:prepilin-type N-terminal cleavage/methylation domain-containing protein
MMNKFYNKKKSGFTLVETLVGLSIFTVALIAFTGVLASGIANTNYVKQKIVAGYLAQEGVEYARNLRDNAILYNASGPQAGWDAFKTTNLSYPVNSVDFPGLTRVITMTSIAGGNEVKITSTVSWTQRSGNYNIVFSENLFNWVE